MLGTVHNAGLLSSRKSSTDACRLSILCQRSLNEHKDNSFAAAVGEGGPGEPSQYVLIFQAANHPLSHLTTSESTLLHLFLVQKFVHLFLIIITSR